MFFLPNSSARGFKNGALSTISSLCIYYCGRVSLSISKKGYKGFHSEQRRNSWYTKLSSTSRRAGPAMGFPLKVSQKNRGCSQGLISIPSGSVNPSGGVGRCSPAAPRRRRTGPGKAQALVTHRPLLMCTAFTTVSSVQALDCCQSGRGLLPRQGREASCRQAAVKPSNKPLVTRSAKAV